MEVCGRAPIIRIDLQLRSSSECWHRNLNVHAPAFIVVGRRRLGSGHERRVELYRELDLHLARPVTLDFALTPICFRIEQT